MDAPRRQGICLWNDPAGIRLDKSNLQIDDAEKTTAMVACVIMRVCVRESAGGGGGWGVRREIVSV